MTLPDHRVELYLHISRVLVERWAMVRGLDPNPEIRAPLRTADALRVLGPVALDIVRGGAHSAVPERRVRAAIETAIRDGRLRDVGSADVVLAHFKSTLGLLVEVGPDAWSFLHLTLAEYFAALDLIRSGELERLATDPIEAFRPEWREVLLLAASELGVNRAEDKRLDTLIRSIVHSAGRRVGRPSAGVPSLLGGLLADDPHLSDPLADLLIKALVPTWWFERAYGVDGVIDVMADARRLIARRISDGPHGAALKEAIRTRFLPSAQMRLLRNVERGGSETAPHLVEILKLVEIDPGSVIEEALGGPAARAVAGASWVTGGWTRAPDGSVSVILQTSAHLDEAVRSGRLDLNLWLQFMADPALSQADPTMPPNKPIHRSVRWSATQSTGTPGRLDAGPLELHADFGQSGLVQGRVRPRKPSRRSPSEARP